MAIFRIRSRSSVEGGEYVMFSYEGLGTGVQEFILTVYGTCMPMLNLNRRKGQDIERYYPASDAKPEEGPINLRIGILNSDPPLTLQFVQRRGIEMRNVPCHLHDPPGSQPLALLIINARD
ncbi:AraC family transcriptional regulator [Enterobacter cancerogenus]|uniref:AraC family transcriptional regulator n=1 Tax=Enterobacter cancerogenus TaxID=69218 RepID=A0A484VX88_9ENTR|nr:AraC family transcriptional regulator [Enterobacter cancerogenus]